MVAMDGELGQITARQNFDHRLIVAMHESQQDHTGRLGRIEETQREHTAALDALDAKVGTMQGGIEAILTILQRLDPAPE